MSAETKIREQIAAAHSGLIHFQHEGEHVVRWLSAGAGPSAYVTFKHQGAEISACCPKCGREIGRFDADYGASSGGQIAAIRYAGADHQC